MSVSRGTTLNLVGSFTASGYLTLYCDGTNRTELTRPSLADPILSRP